MPATGTPFRPGQPVLAVLNVHSGWSDSSDCRKELTSLMEQAGAPLDVTVVRKGMDIPAIVRQAREKGVAAVIAGGGDGTLNAVATGLNGSEIPMGIVPIGTLNHLARDLGIPIDPQRAIDILARSQTRAIDLGGVNGRVFLNNSILGLYPAYRFARERRQQLGQGRFRAIFSALLSVIRGNPTMTLRLSLDGREIVRRTPYVLIANNEHRMEGYQLGAREHLDAGRLWVYIMRPRSRWGLLRMTLALLFGRFHRQQEFEVFPATTMLVEARRKTMGVALDGDVVRMKMPLEYRSLPGALHVIAPEHSAT